MVTADAGEHADGGGSGDDAASQNSIMPAVRAADTQRAPLISAQADAIPSGPPAVHFEWGYAC
ncbi:hypothetical protein RS84_02038 [Microbacterium hydrocarbonoxydans]|uniref:Uncharacterized protein n=1 Tax=Microbacterium hydrocarbonoxydans TaxID=273678 RepID=A0A0M2HS03_9MICO|nr:hypothetical protein [Microbacterium hydrocarbonoxydans]KJL47248.1 hypothetical protein RS84_02038 [Microbacterium hydrocarbonoxydans]